jgi:hypothetical protein
MPPKQVIDLNAVTKYLSFLIYGASRTGKTQLLATFPKPLFIMDGSERGWVTIQSLWQNQREVFYDENTAPVVWPVSNGADMAQAVGEAEAMLRANPGCFGTVIVDSLTFYADSLFADIAARMGDKYDPRKAYGDLGNQLSFLMNRVNNMQVHTAYVCLEKEPEEQGKNGNILLTGGTQFKAPARCNYWMHTEKIGTGERAQYRLFTDSHGKWPAGGRDGGRLPNPLPQMNFKCIEDHLGLPPFVSGRSNTPTARPTMTTSPSTPARTVLTPASKVNK